MYIVAIAWLYVTLMMSIAEHSAVAGIVTFLLYGLLPLAIILYLMGTPRRRQRRKEREAIAERHEPEPAPYQPELNRQD